MTAIDDELLDGLLKSAGAAFSVPASGMDDIVDRVPALGTHERGDGQPSGGRDGRQWMRSHRLLAAAACVVVAFVAAAAVVGWTSRTPATPRAAAPRPAAHRSSSAGAGTHALGLPGSGTTKAKATTGQVASPSTGSSGATLFGPAISAPSATSSTTGATAPTLPSGEVGQPSKIEQTGSLSLVVPKGATAATMSALTSLAGAYGGFVVTSQTQASPGAPGTTRSGTITLQVPVNSFATVVTKAQALGKTSSLTTKATDVTGQYVDLQAQITALQASLQQYLTIMTKATTIGDILSVQAQINTIQSQIQQLQGQLQVLSTETTYSTLTVSVNEKVAPPVPVVHTPAPSGLAKAWHDSGHGFVDALEGLIRIGGPVLFVLLLGGVIVLAVRFGWRRYRRAGL